MKLALDVTAEELAIWLDDADEQIAVLDAAVLTLERAPTPDLIDRIFRAAHTLKGSAAAIGHSQMTDLTHTMENVFDALRSGTLTVSSGIIDALLAAVDSLRILRDEAQIGESRGLDIEPARAAFARLIELVITDDDPPADTTDPVFTVRVTFADDCQFLAVRAFQVIAEMRSIGSVVWSRPSVAEIEAETGSQIVSIGLVTSLDTEIITEAARGIADVVSVIVEVPSDVPIRQHDSVLPAGPDPQGRRLIDLGPEARGTDPEERLKIAASKIAKLSKTIRFDVDRLDDLVDLVSELVIERTRLAQITASIELTATDPVLVSDLTESALRIGRITDELRQKTLHARMMPIDTVFSRFPRMVRDLAQRAGKEIDFIVEGHDTELDRTVIEEIGDPLIHLLRNAVDHGIELPAERGSKPATGRVRLAATVQNNEAILVIEDDGRGISPAALRAKAVQNGLLSREEADRFSDREAIDLIFAAGLSTAETITDVSGRGVGMDIVRSNIERLNGTIAVQTVPGSGTTFTIRVPLTLAIVPSLLVGVDDLTCALPLTSVAETIRVEPGDIHSDHGEETVAFRDTILPVIRLRRVFGLTAGAGDRTFVVAVRWGDRHVGLAVDRLIGGQEVVVKPLGPIVGSIEGISGATILGDGRVGLVLDVAGIVKRALRDTINAVPA